MENKLTVQLFCIEDVFFFFFFFFCVCVCVCVRVRVRVRVRVCFPVIYLTFDRIV